MLTFLFGLFRLLWLFGNGHHAVVLENLALRHQLSVDKRQQKRPRLAGCDRRLWIALSVMWRDWRKALVMVHPPHGRALAERTLPPVLGESVEEVCKTRTTSRWR